MGWWKLEYWKTDGKNLTQAEKDEIAAEVKKGFLTGQIIESGNKVEPLSFPRQVEIEALRANYQGRRIRLFEMPNDNDPIEPGTEGLVFDVDGAGHLMVNWDNGRSLNLIPGVDKFEIINKGVMYDENDWRETYIVPTEES